ncbi:MAG: lipopolysaccharide kinase InaA family protein [Endozoicomonas sp.]
MLNAKSLILKGRKTRILCSGSPAIESTVNLDHGTKLLREGYYADVYQKEGWVIKVNKRRHKSKDTIRNLTLRSRSIREYKGNRMLANLGLQVPRTALHGISIDWTSPVSDILIIQYMKSYSTIENSIVKLRQSGNLKEILGKVANDINKMSSHNVLFGDLHFNNIMVSDKGDICWIDTMSKSEWRLKKFYDKLSSKIEQLHTCKGNRLNPEEWKIFTGKLKLGLS